MKVVLSDSRLPREAVNELSRLGFSTVLLPPDGRLPAPLSSHTDMLIFKYGQTLITDGVYYNNNYKLFESIRKGTALSVLTCGEKLSGIYPNDAILNALVIGDRIFIKSDTASKTLLELAQSEGLKIYKTKQGYPACTVLPLGEGAAITADKGLARTLASASVRVTLIGDSEKIKLPPYDFGFIGGCCGRYHNTVYFIGSLDAHPYADIIKTAIESEGLKYVSLMPESDVLFDLGGLVFCD